eukprot:SM000160S02565  [mRNA]  locus=s160:252685:253119:- [translate_table: standard]
MLLGDADNDTLDRDLRVTVYGNWFSNSHQRQPHCRFGQCHVVNNFYSDWTYYCLGGRVQGNILSEGNAFRPGAVTEVTPWFQDALITPGFDNTATIQSRADLLLDGATFHQFGSPANSFAAPYSLAIRSAGLVEAAVRTQAGPR